MEQVKWKKTLRGLVELHCPVLSHITSVESLQQEGELRNSVVQWLFYTYNPEWMTERELQEDTELRRLTQLAHNLGLCKPDDVAVVKGTSQTARGKDFIHAFVELVLLKEEIEGPMKNRILGDAQFIYSVATGNVFKKVEEPLLVQRLFVPGASIKATHTTEQLQLQIEQLETSIRNMKFELALYRTEDTPSTAEQAEQLFDTAVPDYAEELGKLSNTVTQKRSQELHSTQDLSPTVRSVLQQYQPLHKTLQNYKILHNRIVDKINFDHFSATALPNDTNSLPRYPSSPSHWPIEKKWNQSRLGEGMYCRSL